MKHIPVLLQEVKALFHNKTLHTFCDATVGAGGHAALLLQEHPELQHFMAYDKDVTALEIAADTVRLYADIVTFQQQSFCDIKGMYDGILLDVGVSSMQLNEAHRGFSFSKEGPLDMRMDQTACIDAAYILNHYSEKQLEIIFETYGEIKGRKAAAAIVYARKKKPFETTLELVHVLEQAGFHRRGKKHPATLFFQALRIAVNQELEELEQGISNAFGCLQPEGIMAVITFHSLEDRIVKHFFMKHRQEHQILTKKPIIPSYQEIRVNPRARSAKLRAIQKCAVN